MPTSGLPVARSRMYAQPVLPTSAIALRVAAVHAHVHQHDRVGGVVVPEVVMHFLEVPAVLAGRGVDRDDRRRVEVVARAVRAVVVGARVARREVDEPELRIDGGRLPDGAAAVLPRVVRLRPAVVARLAGPRYRVERPDQPAVLRVERLHAAARAAVAAREADDHLAVVVDRRGRDREVLLPALGRDVPERLAGRAIERDEPRVEPADEHLVAAHRDAAARPAATDRREAGVEVRGVLPEDLAAVDRHGEHVVGARAHVGDAVVDDRLRLARVLRA